MTYINTLDALGDPTRRKIVEILRAGPQTVGELADRLPVSQPAVSQHLAVLREAGLVSSEKDGVRRVQHLNPDGFAALRGWVETFWDEALQDYRSTFEGEQERKTERWRSSR